MLIAIEGRDTDVKFKVIDIINSILENATIAARKEAPYEHLIDERKVVLRTQKLIKQFESKYSYVLVDASIIRIGLMHSNIFPEYEEMKIVKKLKKKEMEEYIEQEYKKLIEQRYGRWIVFAIDNGKKFTEASEDTKAIDELIEFCDKFNEDPEQKYFKIDGKQSNYEMVSNIIEIIRFIEEAHR